MQINYFDLKCSGFYQEFVRFLRKFLPVHFSNFINYGEKNLIFQKI